MNRSAVVAVLAIALSSAPAFAQDMLESSSLLVLGNQLAEQSAVESNLPIAYTVVVRPEQRPAPLVPMYVAQGVLQGLDLYTTFRALDASHREANPLFKNGNRATMAAAKLAAVSWTIYTAEKVWKRDRKRAIVLMIATNAIMAAVVANNSRVLRH
jgi:hypothetical protein